MIAQVGDILIDKLVGLPFLDKYAGVVKPIVYNEKSGAGNKTALIRKTFPAACRTTWADCQGGRYMDLVPDSSKKSVLYLEDLGLRAVAEQGAYLTFVATYDLVCWLNMPLLGYGDCSYSGIAIASILKKLPARPFNTAKYQLVDIRFTSQKPKSVNPFAKYSYDEAVNQFLMYPYDYFVLGMEVGFRINLNCINIEALEPELECVTK